MPVDGPVRMTREENVAVVRLEGPRANAINDRLMDGLIAALQAADDDPQVRGVLLTTGRKLFSPGLDLQDLIDRDRPAMDHFMERFGSCLFRLYTFPKPLVAAVAGHAVAGGCVLALTADLRLLGEGAMIGLNEIQVGVPLPYGVALLLRDTASPRHLEEIALLGKNYRGPEAVEAGLVHDVVPVAELESRARSRLDEFAAKDPCAFAATKLYLRRPTVERIRTAEARHRPEFLDCWFSEGTQARIRGIVEDLRSRSS